MLKLIHKVSAGSALALIVLSLSGTLASELVLGQKAIAAAKKLILHPGLTIMILSIILAGITGFVSYKSKTGRIISRKRLQTLLIALNSLLILIPCALFLHLNSHNLNNTFYVVQSIEIAAGTLNLFLISLNIYYGIKLKGINDV